MTTKPATPTEPIPDGWARMSAENERRRRDLNAAVNIARAVKVAELNVEAAFKARQQAAAPGRDMPEAGTVAKADAGAPPKRCRKPAWHTVAMPYMKTLYHDGKYSSAKAFYQALLRRAGQNNSPFTKVNGGLFCTVAGTTVAEGTIGTMWAEIRGG